MTPSALRVKICGMVREADARVAREAGADVVGAVLVPSSPRCVTPEEARSLGRAADLPLAVVLAGLAPDEVVSVARRAGAAVVQLHDDTPPEAMEQIRRGGPWELWKAARVRSGEEMERAAERFGPWVDLLLLDAWHPRQLGGTGHRFPWSELEACRDRLPEGLSLGVAGGLDPDSVGEAVRRLAPSLVDVSSGVEEAPGRKDPHRIHKFVREARAAAPPLAATTKPTSPAPEAPETP
ncbi:MAG: phosphoribosylanthranilate isomerase [Gemmatimonadales bacterium]|nr:MAG: phosphoribosylanthranilate isomerase [Gemmatimonadales bacterium]